jgi:hypothetical protein
MDDWRQLKTKASGNAIAALARDADAVCPNEADGRKSTDSSKGN